ncbi:MAG: serine/threonine-protein kinase, partial [Acidobacteriota bacterium]|nr:serine/threonine-protein kinase [Acidobacteriota bacterium]
MTDDALFDAAAAVADGESRSPLDSLDLSVDERTLAELRIIHQVGRVHREASLADSFAAAAESHTPVVEPPAAEGVKWGELQVLERLGSGSFGDVHRAWDPALSREVALKLLRSDRGGKQTVTEGQLLARIRHANVMAIYGAAEFAGRVGIWGELLRGRTLATIVRDDGPLGAAEVLIVADALCRALAAAHRAGVLHRDVKAENVIRETGGRIVLMDFGLGRAIDAGSSGGSAGTPAYLAPELFTGAPASVSTDIYAVGVLLFYLSTGEYPVIAPSFEGLAQAQAEGRRKKLPDLRPELPTAFVQLVDRALQPRPDDRFASAGEMQSAIVSASHPVVVAQRRLGGWQLVRQPWILGSLVANVVLVVAAAIWLT